MLAILLIVSAAATPVIEGMDLFVLADAAERAGSYENASRLFIQCAQESEPLRPYALSRAAQNQADAGNVSAAERLFEQVLREFPRGPWVRLTQARLGRLYLKHNLPDRARTHLNEAFRDLDPVPWFLTSLAWNRAENALKISEHAHEGYAHFRSIAANTIYAKERLDAAGRLMRSADSEDRMWGIYGLVRGGNLQGGRAALAAAPVMVAGPEGTRIPLSALDPILSQAETNLTAAIANLDILARANAESQWVRIWLMLALREQAGRNRPAVAESLIDLMLKYFGEGRDAGDACWWLAERYEKEDNRQGAERMYRWLADRAPTHVRAPRSLYNLANRAREAGRTEEAFRLYEELGTAHPRAQFSAEGYYRCAEMAAKQGDANRERYYLDRAARVGPGQFYAHRALRLLHQKTGAAPENARRLQVVPGDDFLLAHGGRDTAQRIPMWLITHIPAYGRLKFFGMHGLEEGEWEALACMLTSPVSLQKLWYIAAAEAGFMHTVNQFVVVRGWGLENGLPTPERLRVEYPLAYWPAMKQVAEELGVDPYLLLAVAKQESTFRAGVVSSAGATGVLQLMPATARWLAQVDSRISADHMAHLKSPLNSIRLGAVYMERMLKRSDQNKVYALASYNAGPGNCDRWRARFPGYSTEAFIEAIPFSETHDYVKKVLANYAAYHSLYPPPGEVVASTAE